MRYHLIGNYLLISVAYCLFLLFHCLRKHSSALKIDYIFPCCSQQEEELVFIYLSLFFFKCSYNNNEISDYTERKGPVHKPEPPTFQLTGSEFLCVRRILNRMALMNVYITRASYSLLIYVSVSVRAQCMVLLCFIMDRSNHNLVFGLSSTCVWVLSLPDLPAVLCG